MTHDTTHLVEHRYTQSNKALQFIVGLVAIALIWKAWWSGWAYDWGFEIFNRPGPAAGEGFGSVTGFGAIIVLLIDAICLLGMALIAFASGIWAVIKDLLATAQSYTSAGFSHLGGGAGEQAAVGAAVSSTRAKPDQPQHPPLKRRVVDPDKLKLVLDSQKSRIEDFEQRLKFVEAKVFSPLPTVELDPPKEPDVSESERLDEIELTLAKLGDTMVSRFDELMKPKAPARRKAGGSK